MGCSGWDVGGGARGPFGLGAASHSTAQAGSSVIYNYNNIRIYIYIYTYIAKFMVQVNIMTCGVGVSEGGVLGWWGGLTCC